MCVHVNQLPDDCLLPIFDRIPLLDLLRLDRVCPRWKFLLPSACARRHTLVLIGGGHVPHSSYYFHIPFNSAFEVSFDDRQPYFNLPAPERFASLSFRYLVHHPNVRSVCDPKEEEEHFTELARLWHARLSARQLVTYFTKLFPNVDNLVFLCTECGEQQLSFLVHLLRSSSWSLTILKLWLQTSYIYRYSNRYRGRPDLHPVGTLLHAIAQQSSLRQLTLDTGDNGDDFDDDFDEAIITFPIFETYSFIERLKVVKLSLGKHNRNTISTLHDYDHPELRHIGMGHFRNSRAEVVLIIPQFQFTAKVSQIYCNLGFANVAQFGEFCMRFPSLTSLQMFWFPDITFSQLVANLRSLSQLTYLKLNVNFLEHNANPFALTDREVDGVEEDQDRLISLAQIKVLELDIHSRTHLQFESLSPRVFPSLEVIILLDYRQECTICHPDIIYYFSDPEMSECHRLLIHSMKDSFVNQRLYARDGLDGEFVDWSANYVFEDDEAANLPEFDDEPKEDESRTFFSPQSND